MSALRASVNGRDLRIAALLVPLPLAAVIVGTGESMTTLARILGVAAVVMGAVMCMLVIAGARRPVADRGPAVSRIDVLTSTGATIMGAGMLALLVSCVVGWASAAVIGTLGITTVYAVVAWTTVVAPGNRPWRGARVTRAIIPAHATEGDALREDIQLAGIRIPFGMRLFVVGPALRDGASSRYAIDSRASRGTLALSSELGAAVRGQHVVPPLALCLGDVLGLTRTGVIARGGGAELTVVPRVPTIDKLPDAIGAGGDGATSAPAIRMPTEGSFQIRDYAAGDDARRIHWVRTLTRDQLTVRLPDELPPVDPDVRVVLDTALDGAGRLSCRAPHELLDALVRVWLGIGKALADAGTRVTLVTAIAERDAVVTVQQPLSARAWASDWLRLGARVTWQATTDVRSLIRRGANHVIVTSLDHPPPRVGDVAWVVLPESAWTTPEPRLVIPPALRLAFPIGAVENRWERVARERLRASTQRDDRALFTGAMRTLQIRAYAGHHVALPSDAGVALEVIS